MERRAESQEAIHIRLEMQQEQNATAIRDLTEAVKSLADTAKKEDDELRRAVQELIKSQAECDYRYKTITQRIDLKQSIIDEVKTKISTKASKGEVKALKAFIHQALWWLFGGMVGVIGFLIKITVFKG